MMRAFPGDRLSLEMNAAGRMSDPPHRRYDMRKMPWLPVVRFPVWRRRILTVYIGLDRA
jgi:hypothetical protein